MDPFEISLCVFLLFTGFNLLGYYLGIPLIQIAAFFLALIAIASLPWGQYWELSLCFVLVNAFLMAAGVGGILRNGSSY